MKKLHLILAFSVLLGLFACRSSHPGYKAFYPGKIWKDNDSIAINAHGGGVTFYNGTYYWFGEHKIAGKHGNSAQVGVHVYSSNDLYNWKNEGIALKVDPVHSNSEIEKGCIIERPKVIYNAKTQKFVMWFHLELKGHGYGAARTAVATAEKITGPYTYLKSYNPNANYWPENFTADQKAQEFPDSLKWWTQKWEQAVKDGLFVHRDYGKGQMSRDMTIFVDDDGKAYHIHSSEENQTIQISELTDNYTGFTGRYVRILAGDANEAPAILKHNGTYYLITSGCTGWAPNEARMAKAENIFGPWTKLENPCRGKDAKLTFHSQSTFILPVHGKNDQFIFMADRWNPSNPIDGRYLWLPIKFVDNSPVIEWKDQWTLDELE